MYLYIVSTPIDKRKIIAAINETDDERILFAINRLLRIDDDENIPDWHKQVLHEREEKIRKGEEKFYDWNDVKDEIKKPD